MSAQSISGLADVIKEARLALAGVPAVADELKATASSVLAKVKRVQDLTAELKDADIQLDAAIGQLSNGAPPLESSAPSAPPIPPSSVTLNEAGVIPEAK